MAQSGEVEDEDETEAEAEASLGPSRKQARVPVPAPEPLELGPNQQRLVPETVAAAPWKNLISGKVLGRSATDFKPSDRYL